MDMQAEDNAARAATDCERARERICRDIPTCKSDFVTRSGLLHAVVMVPSMYGEVEDEATAGEGGATMKGCSSSWMMTEYAWN